MAHGGAEAFEIYAWKTYQKASAIKEPLSRMLPFRFLQTTVYKETFVFAGWAVDNVYC